MKVPSPKRARRTWNEHRSQRTHWIGLRANLGIEYLEDRTVPAVLTDFDVRFSVNAPGDIAFVSNTLMTATDAGNRTSQDVLNAQNGVGNFLNNNDFIMGFVDVDQDSSTFNSSAATLTLPQDGSVLFAGLYWGGNSNASNRNEVKFQTPTSNGYLDVVGEIVGNDGSVYQAFADVTDLVQKGGAGELVVANVQATKDQTNQHAGWALVVVMEAPSAAVRNLTVFDGFAQVRNSNSNDDSVRITVNGFTTPPQGPVTTSLGIIAYEGDLGLTGDQLLLEGTALSDAQHPATNFINSTISRLGSSTTDKQPNFVNQLGFDASIVDASNILANNANQATITLTTNGDAYFPGVVTTAIDLFSPTIQAVQTVTDVNRDQVRAGDVLEYEFVINNVGNDDAAQLVFTDPIPAGTTYVANSLEIVSGINAGRKTDDVGDDVADFDVAQNQIIFRLGNGADAKQGGTLGNVDQITIKFQVRIDAGATPGTVITNQAQLRYEALTSQIELAGNSTATTENVEQGNSAPIANPDQATAIQNQPIIVDVLANDVDIDGDPLSVVNLTPATNGQATLMPSNQVQFVPNPNFLGAASFGYVVSDGQGSFGSATVSISVVPPPAPPNQNPVAVPDFIRLTGGRSSFLPVLNNDFDPDGDALSIVSVTQGIGGAVAISGGAGLIFTPTRNFVGADQFSYLLSDGRGGLAQGSVNLNVQAPAFFAVQDSFTMVNRGGTMILDVLANDVFAPGSQVSFTSFTATFGQVQLTQDGLRLMYTPPSSGFSGLDQVSYTISDGFGQTGSATVSILVLPSAPGLTSQTAVLIGNSTSATLRLGIAPLLGGGEDSAASRILAANALMGADGTGILDGSGGTGDTDAQLGTAMISGVVFDDDGDGRRGVREPGLANATVILEQQQNDQLIMISSTTTDDEGNYAFRNLKAGFYRVRYVKPKDELLSFPMEGEHRIELPRDGHERNRSFGVVPLRPRTSTPVQESAEPADNSQVSQPEAVKWIDLDLNVLDKLFRDPTQLWPIPHELFPLASPKKELDPLEKMLPLHLPALPPEKAGLESEEKIACALSFAGLGATFWKRERFVRVTKRHLDENELL